MLAILKVSSACLIGCGLVLAIVVPSASVQAKTEHVLYPFKSYTDGDAPVAGLIIDSAGNLYGTTLSGGAENAGTVFAIAPDGTEKILHSFGSGSDGEYPSAGLVMDNDGNLYGTAYAGGDWQRCDCGVVFKLTPNGAETVLHTFERGSDGGYPVATLILKHGEIYGTTRAGGAGGGTGCGGFGCGTVFSITQKGVETVLYAFTGGSDGGSPNAGVISDKGDNLYGTTAQGGDGTNCSNGSGGCGTVFRLAADGTETTLYSFAGGDDAAEPWSGVIMDKAGGLYGTTEEGGGTGCYNGYGCGTVFKLALDGSETVLYSFCSQSNCSDGAQPDAGVILRHDGHLYGTTVIGGSIHNRGVVFDLAPNGTEKVLHTFRGKSDGREPEAGLVFDSVGNLYGTTSSGGGACSQRKGCGTVFEIEKSTTQNSDFKTENTRIHGEYRNAK